MLFVPFQHLTAHKCAKASPLVLISLAGCRDSRAALNGLSCVCVCVLLLKVRDPFFGPLPRRVLPLHRQEPRGRPAAAPHRGPGGV